MKKVRLAQLLLIAAIAVSLGIVAAAVAVRVLGNRGTAVPVAVDSTGNFLVIPDFRHSQYDGTRLAWDLSAKKALFQDMSHAALEEPTLKIHSEEHGILTVVFKEGTIDLQEKRLDAGGGVTARNEEGYSLSSSEFHYDGNADTLWTTTGFTLRGKDVSGSGSALTLYPKRRQLEATGGVKIIYYPKGLREGLS